MDIYLSTILYWITGIAVISYIGLTFLSSFFNMVLNFMAVVGAG